MHINQLHEELSGSSDAELLEDSTHVNQLHEGLSGSSDTELLEDPTHTFSVQQLVCFPFFGFGCGAPKCLGLIVHAILTLHLLYC